MERTAYAVQRLVNRVNWPADFLGDRLEARRGIAVAALHQLAIPGGELAEALAEGVAAEVEQVGATGSVSGEPLAGGVAQLETGALRITPKLANLVVGNDADPLHE